MFQVVLGTEIAAVYSSTYADLLRIREKIKLKNRIDPYYCKYMLPGAAFSTLGDKSLLNQFLDLTNRTEYIPIIFHSPCIDKRSFGNSIGYYIETRACAEIAGAHYISTNEDWYPNDAFLNSFPIVVNHPFPQPLNITKTLIASHCPCRMAPHECNDSIILRKPKYAKEIFINALINYANSLNESDIQLHSKDVAYYYDGNHTHYHQAVKHRKLPTVPDTAIHYQCGDLQQGLIPFQFIVKKILENSRSIFVISEIPTRNQKSIPYSQIKIKCNNILSLLFNYIIKYFPTSIIAILRGHNVYHDLFRLTFANSLVCSPTSLCTFPAIAQSHTVHFPVSESISNGHTINYGPHVRWFSYPPVMVFDSKNKSTDNSSDIYTKLLTEA